MRLLLLLLILAIPASGLYFYLNPKRALEFVVPSLNSVNNIGLEIKGDTAYLNVFSVMENKAPYNINIRSIAYTVRLGEVDILTEKNVLNLKQDPKQIDTVGLSVRLPYLTIGKLIKDLQGRDSTTVALKFNITYNTLFGEVTIPASYTIPIKTPNPPQVTLNKIRLGFFNFKEMRFQLILDLDLENKNSWELSLDDISYDAEFGDNLTGKGELDEVLTIGSKATTNIRLPVVISVTKPMEVIWDIITNKDRMDYTLNLRGKLIQTKLDRKDIPFDVILTGNAELVNSKRKKKKDQPTKN